MSQNNRAEAQPVIDVTVLVGVEDIALLTSDKNIGIFFTPVAEVGIDAVRKGFLGALKQLIGARPTESHGSP